MSKVRGASQRDRQEKEREWEVGGGDPKLGPQPLRPVQTDRKILRRRVFGCHVNLGRPEHVVTLR